MELYLARRVGVFYPLVRQLERGHPRVERRDARRHDLQVITEIEDYFAKGCGRCERFETSDCATAIWAEVLRPLREICLAAGLSEHVKWGQPCYMHAGRNVALIGALRGDVRLSFFYPTLMTDPDGVLERQGPNTQHADVIAISGGVELEALRPVIAAYLAEAKGYAEAGVVPEKTTPTELDLPDELVEVMDRDPELAEAFHSLTPGRQRSYVIHLNGAKASKTRRARIEKARPKILAGKGAMER